ncbi:hypothetical protein NUH88_02305 [Nisaea acidiphila]|uniref:C-type lysozyme inhibitor domain-containing protein n=1 Tax=Nisaea acidiphila TaxID=1862145 RepID=A0A9J7AW87_9PROT|nr:hypothetical protein [Nisaea acidiphila]UUX50532.1 hypothetical protein NUH88_02305 [Nisaea acidiphila]
MPQLVSTFLMAVALFGLTACFGEEEKPGPKMDHINVRNDSSTEARVRVKLWTEDILVVSAGDSGKMEFKAGSRTVQVEARSRKQWDDCWVTMQVGETLVVSDAGERIGCSVE